MWHVVTGSHTSARCMHSVRIWHDCVTLLQHATCWFVTNSQYNTGELCMYLHANSVYCASYSFLRHTGISTKTKSIFFKIVEITSSKIKTCCYDLWIKKWLYTNNSYLALLTQSCKPDCHVGLKIQCDMISIKINILCLKELVERMWQCQIGLDWCQIFPDTFSWIHFLKFLADVRHMNLYE